MCSVMNPPVQLEYELAQAALRLDAAASDLTALTAAGGVEHVAIGSLPAFLTLLIRSIDAAQAVASRATAQVHVTGAALDAEFGSTRSWLARTAHISGREASAIIKRSMALRNGCSATWEAWNDGRISGAAAREISIGLDSVYRGVPWSISARERPLAEEVLLGLAEVATVEDVARSIGRLRDAVVPDGSSAAAMEAHDAQQLTCSPVGAMAVLTAYLDNEGQAVVMTALDQIVDGWYRTGSLHPEDLVDGSPALDPVSRRLRRPHLLALALVELARRQLENGVLGSRHGTKPHVMLTADVADVAAGLPGYLRVPGQDEPVAVPADTVRRIMCDADLTAVVTTLVRPDHEDDLPSSAHDDDPAGPRVIGLTGRELAAWLRREFVEVLWVHRTERSVHPRLRRALEARDRHCAFRGCRVDTSRTEAHHVLEWEHGGLSTLANTVLLCSKHHHSVHEGGGHLSPAPGLAPGAHGYWEFTPPARPRWP